jgi:hypothetical protein
MKEYSESVIKEIEARFNDKSLDTMIFGSRFENFKSLLELQDIEIKKNCDNIPILNAEGVIADLKFSIFLNKNYA